MTHSRSKTVICSIPLLAKWHGPGLLLGVLALGCPPLCVQAQSTGNILGRITSGEGGLNLQNAVVSISGTEIQVLSGEEGWYFLTGIPVGRQEVVVRLLGFVEVADTVELGADDTVVLDFALDPEPVPLEEVVVSAEAEPLGRLAHRRVIRADEIARTQATTFSQLLQGLVPGVTQTVRSGDVGAAAQIRIRGIRSLESSPPLFFVDGVRVGSARFRGPEGTGGILTFLDNINPRDVQRIEILQASEATTLFGTDAAGGAILIYTKR